MLHNVWLRAPVDSRLHFIAPERTTLSIIINKGVIYLIYLSIIIENPEEDVTRIPAHKFVVASGSPVFEAMFYGTLREPSDEIRTRDTNSASFRNMLWYLYSDEFVNDEIDMAELVGRLDLARKYMIRGLELLCIAYFQQNLEAHNVFQVLSSSQLLHFEKLEETCWKMVEEKTADIFNDSSFLSISQDLLQMLLKRPSLNASEKDVFLAAHQWAERECERKQLEDNPLNRRQVLGPAFYAVHFSAMSHQEFANVVIPTAVLTNEESLQIFLSMSSDTPPEIAFPTLSRPKPEAILGSWCHMGVPATKCTQFSSARVVDQLEVRPTKTALLTAIEVNQFALADLLKASVSNIVLTITPMRRGRYSEYSKEIPLLNHATQSPVGDDLIFILESPFKLSDWHLIRVYWRGTHAPTGNNRKVTLPAIQTVTCNTITFDIKNHVTTELVDSQWQYLQWSLIQTLRFATV